MEGKKKIHNIICSLCRKRIKYWDHLFMCIKRRQYKDKIIHQCDYVCLYCYVKMRNKKNIIKY